MSDRPRILLALTPLVEREVEAELFGAATGIDVVASAADAHELGELLRTHRADAVLVSPDLSGLGGAHTAAASAAGLRVIGLALDDIGREALGSLGIDEILTLPIDEGARDSSSRPRSSTSEVGGSTSVRFSRRRWRRQQRGRRGREQGGARRQ